MGEITLSVPDDLDLTLNIQPDEVPHELLLAAAIKLFEMGKISSGKASELAGIPKPLFLTKLAELGFRLSNEARAIALRSVGEA